MPISRKTRLNHKLQYSSVAYIRKGAEDTMLGYPERFLFEDREFRRVEFWFKGFVAESKVNIAIKNLDVVWGNFSSGLFILKSMGVPTALGYRYGREYWEHKQSYLQLKEDEVEIYQLLRELYDKYNLDRYRVNRERVALLLNVRDAFKQAKIVTDRQRLSRALSCLMENALTQTKKGVVEIGALFADKNLLVFTVKDSSNMLLQERARKVFETTEKEEDWYNTSDTIGLGYKLARGLIEAMNGEIVVKDSSFKGTTIECSIPVKTVTPKYYQSGEADRIKVERPQEE